MSNQQTVEINSVAAVLQELKPLIEDIQRKLEKGLDSDQPTAEMADVAARLGEVAGTLQLLDLHGPARLAREMRWLATALAEDRIEAVETALDRLLRAVFRLPGYLDRIRAGQRDVPLVLLPLLNELRSARGEQALSEQALFMPDIGVEFPRDEQVADSGELQAVARRLRLPFMKAFLGWHQGRDTGGALAELGRLTEELAATSTRRGVERFWRAAGAVVESLGSGEEQTAINGRRLLIRVERLLSVLVRRGEAALAREVPDDLLRDLLYHVAHLDSTGEAVAAVQRRHRLTEMIPGEDAAAGLEGPNRDLMEAVGEGIREDLKQVKNAVEIFVHSEERRPEALDGLPPQLDRIADTFSMLGLPELHDALEQQARAVDRLDPDAGDAETRLQGLADLLLRADNDLLALQSGRPVVSGGGIEVDDDAEALAIRRLPDSEYFPLVSALVSAALENLARVREAIGAFCADPESGRDALGEVPALLDEVHGAMEIVALRDALPALEGLHAHVRDNLVVAEERPDEQTQMLIADVVAGIEYYLEAVDHDRVGMGYLLASANRAVEALHSGGEPEHYEGDEEVVIGASDVPSGEPDEQGADTPETPAVSEQRAAAPAGAANRVVGTAEDGAGGETLPVDDDASEDTVAAPADDTRDPTDARTAAPGVDPAASGSSRLPIMGDEVDEEIVEVFIEEALGELEKINENLCRWRRAPDDEDSLIVIRRAYHTLKGGGRLIGAELIGEFSWAMENLLNRVIDHTVDANEAVFETMDEASAALPQLIEQLQGNRAPIDGIDELIARAHALSRGEEPPPGGGGGSSEPPAAPPGGDEEVASDTGDDTGLGETTPVAEKNGVNPGPEPARPAGEPPESRDAAETDAEAPIEPRHGEEAQTPDVGAAADGSEDDGTEAGDYYDRADLLQIFSDEAAGYCKLLIEECGEPGRDFGELTITDEARRALHTLVGSAQTADVPAIAEMAAVLRELVHRHRQDNYRLSAAKGELFREAVARLAEMQGEARAGTEPRAGEILDRLRAVEAKREPATETSSAEEQADPELLAVFLEEADEILEVCDHSLASWRTDSRDRNAVSDLQRALHTLKGGARMSHLPALADLTHEIESVIEAAAEGACSLDENAFDLLQEAIDALTVQVEHVRAHKPLSPVDWLAQDLRSLYGAGGRGSETDDDDRADSVEEPETIGNTSDNEPPAEAGVDDTAAGLSTASQPAAPADPAPAAGVQRSGTSEQIRVQAELLDNLVNFAGEVSIYHSRLGEQMSQYRFNLNEFQQTVGRVREQLRIMENETESQILYRNQKEADSPDEDWDPLEFDRYTRIQELSRSLAESVGDLDSIKEILDNLTRDAETLLLQQSRVSSDLQSGLMQTRMVRFDGLRARLGRVVRQTSNALGKKVDLEMTGGELEIDRSVQERVIAPLEHVLRNAVSHGIEPADKRRKRGKPEQGTIRLDLHRGGSDIVIEISDDGGGIDPEKVRRKGIDKGLIAADDDMDDSEVIKLILETGFSTADEVTQISGRGVGMDVVDSEIRHLGGTLGIQTELGTGTTFTVRLPVTLAINQAVLVGAGDQEYAIPIASIEGVAQVTAGDLKAYYVDPEKRFAYGGHEYRIRHLGSLLGVSDPRLEDEDISYPVIMIRAGDERVGMHVDQLLGRREVVVKPVGAPVNTLPAISGATIMADGKVVLILDMGGLLGTEHRFIARRRSDAEVEAEDAASDGIDEGTSEDRAPTVLVVDDSITIRKVTQRILARNGIQVATAKDGVDAVSWMSESVPDLVLLDIEMPRMDGYEVANYVRGDDRLAKVPIIMITSRTGRKHRERAEGIGVDRYLGKPYQETELMEHIRELLPGKAAA